jgi:Salmonella virulence plasmid 65kDa B protein
VDPNQTNEVNSQRGFSPGDPNKETPASEEQSTSAPAISLPKGGGAIKGTGEKFGVNPVNGSSTLSVPVFTTPGRSKFSPDLSLSYDSGNGNGPFRFGWHLSVPSITRKTDKGLPCYFDAEESDVYILSGAEDLVPVLVQDMVLAVDDYGNELQSVFSRRNRRSDSLCFCESTRPIREPRVTETRPRSP